MEKGLRLLGGDQHFPATAQQARYLEHNAGDMNRQGVGFVQDPIDREDLVLGVVGPVDQIKERSRIGPRQGTGRGQGQSTL